MATVWTRSSGTYKSLFAVCRLRVDGLPERSLLKRLSLTPSRAVGIALVIVGVLLLMLAYGAQSRIDEIGTTDEPALLHEISLLEDQRDVYLVTSIACIFLGLFAVALLGEASTPIIATRSQMVSTARALNDVASGLSLTGNAIFLPAKHGLSMERMFVPATKGSSTPPGVLSDDMVMSPGKDGSTPGLITEPLGLSLLNNIEQELNARLTDAGLEAAEGTLQILKHGMGVMKDFHFKEREGRTVMRVEYSGLLEACRDVRKEKPDTCRQVPCFGCSCLLLAAARSTGKLVNIDDVDNKQDTVVFTLNIREW